MIYFTSDELSLLVQRAANATTILEEQLNAADRELGDGDTGTMLARLLRALAGVDIRGTSLSEALNTLAFTASASTGSSLGTLISAALFAMSQQTKSHTGPLPAPETAALLISARNAMLELGKSKLGDKTIIDSVDAVAVSIAGLNDWATIMNTAGKQRKPSYCSSEAVLVGWVERAYGRKKAKISMTPAWLHSRHF